MNASFVYLAYCERSTDQVKMLMQFIVQTNALLIDLGGSSMSVCLEIDGEMIIKHPAMHACQL